MTERRKRLTRRLPPSGWRHNRRTEYYQDGERHVSEQRVRQFASLAVIPVRDRLVDVFDAQEHQVATLVHTGNGPPLLYVPAVDRPAPEFVLVGDKLFAAHVTHPDEGGELVQWIGTPRDEFPLWCAPCRQEFTVYAAELDAKRPAHPTRRTPRVYVH